MGFGFSLISDYLDIFMIVIFRLLYLISLQIEYIYVLIFSILGFIFLMCFEILDCTLTWNGRFFCQGVGAEGFIFLVLFFLLCSFVLNNLAMTSTWTHRVSSPEPVSCWLIRFTLALMEIQWLSERQLENQVGGGVWFLTTLPCLIPWPQQHLAIAFSAFFYKKGEPHPCYLFRVDFKLWYPSCHLCGFIEMKLMAMSACICTRIQEELCSFSLTNCFLFLRCYVC